MEAEQAPRHSRPHPQRLDPVGRHDQVGSRQQPAPPPHRGGASSMRIASAMEAVALQRVADGEVRERVGRLRSRSDGL